MTDLDHRQETGNPSRARFHEALIEENSDLIDRIGSHRILDLFLQGPLTEELKRRWIPQAYLVTREYERFLAVLLAGMPAESHGPCLSALRFLHDRLEAYEEYVAEKIGSPTNLRMGFAAHALVSHLHATVHARSQAEAVTACLALRIVWREMQRRTERASGRVDPLWGDHVTFWDREELPDWVDCITRSIDLASETASSELKQRMTAAFRVTTYSVLRFFDSILEGNDWDMIPSPTVTEVGGASRFHEMLLAENAALLDRVRQHPLMGEIAAGTIAREPFHGWLCRTYLWERDFARFLTKLSLRVPMEMGRAIHETGLNVYGHIELFRQMAAKVGVDLRESRTDCLCHDEAADLLLAAVHTRPFDVALAACYGENLALREVWAQPAGRRTEPGPWQDFVDQWRDEDFARWVDRLARYIDTVAETAPPHRREAMAEIFRIALHYSLHSWTRTLGGSHC